MTTISATKPAAALIPGSSVPGAPPPSPGDVSPEEFLNRDVSWLEFNRRVLHEAVDERTPLLERVRFLSIFSSNLDEYFMKRVGGLKRQILRGWNQPTADGLTPLQTLAAIRGAVLPLLRQQGECFTNAIRPALAANGVHLLTSSVFIAILLMAVLSVPLLFLRQYRLEFEPVFQLASVFILALVPLIYYYYTAWRLAEPTTSWTRFPGRFLLFLAMSMGLSLHNTLAVLAGLAGRRSAFIRTPKLGLAGAAQQWQQRYRTGGLDLRTGLEGLLALYFLFGLGAGLYFRNFGLLPFHLLLTVGFGLVFYYTVRHNRVAA